MERAVLEGVRRGDAACFEALFRQYCQDLVRFAHRYTRDIPAAENTVQEVFLRVWRDRQRLDPSANVKAYLYTAVRNESLKVLRHAEVEDRHADGLTVASPRTPEDEWRDRSTACAVHQAIEQLPDRRRRIFQMNRFDHLTYAEIAQVLEISIKTVETQMGRALASLRDALAGHLEG